MDRLLKTVRAWLIRHHILVYAVLGLPLLVVGLYQFTHYYILPLRYVSWSKIHLFGMPLLEALLLFAILDYHSRIKDKGRPSWWEYVLVFSTANLVLVFLFLDFYSSHAMQEAASVKLVLSLLPFAKTLFLLLSILSFVMGFQSQFRGIFQIYESGAGEGEASTEQRSDRNTAILLIVLFAVGLGLRLYNLDGFPPHVDEYAHTEQALSMIRGTPGEYDRSFLPVTVPVYLSFLVFGADLWFGRLPMVLLNMLAIFPLYSLGRRIHRSVGLICAALYASSPWMTASSRTVREYAIQPLAAYVVAVLLLELLNWDSMTVSAFIRKNKYRLLAVALIFAYLAFDNESTLKSALLTYGVFGILSVLKVVKSNLSRRTILTSLVLMGAGLLVVLFTQPQFYTRYFQGSVLIYAPVYWKMVMFSAIHHGYVIDEFSYLILALVVILTIYAVYKKYTASNFALLFICLALVLNLLYLSYFLAHPGLPARPRYGVLVENWYLPLTALAIWVLYNLLRQRLNTIHPNIIFVCMAILFVNLPSVQKIITYRGGGVAPVTGNPHYITEPARDFLASVITRQDVLISDVVFRYDNITGLKLKTRENVRFVEYLTSVNEPFAASAIHEFPRGWVAVSPNSRPDEAAGFQFEDFILDGKQLHYMGQIGDIYIWQWSE